MTNSENTKIDALHEEIRRLREHVAAAREVERLDQEIRFVREQIGSTKTVLDGISGKSVDLQPLQDAIATLGKEISAVEKKTPPLATLAGAFFIIIAAVGASFFNVITLKEPIDQVENSVSNVVQQVQTAVDTLETVQNDLKAAQQDLVNEQSNIIKLAQELNADLSEIRGNLVEDLTNIKNDLSYDINSIKVELTEGLEKVSNFDEIVAGTITKLQKLQTTATNVAPSTGSGMLPADAEFDLASAIADLTGGDLPKHISLLSDATSEIDKGNYELARQMLLDAKGIDEDDKEPIYDFMIGQSYYKEERYADSIDAFKIALSLEPDSATTHNNIGTSYYALAMEQRDTQLREGYLRESVESHRHAAEISGQNGRVEILNLAIALNALGEHDEAVDVLSAFDGEADGDILVTLAGSYALKGFKSQAFATLGEALALNKHLALQAAADADFASLRTDDRFIELLESVIGSDLMDAVRAAWDAEAQDSFGH